LEERERERERERGGGGGGGRLKRIIEEEKWNNIKEQNKKEKSICERVDACDRVQCVRANCSTWLESILLLFVVILVLVDDYSCVYICWILDF
jgi:hypothetical protein